MSPHGIHRYVYITLKKSLRWVPIIGWVCVAYGITSCGLQFKNFNNRARACNFSNSFSWLVPGHLTDSNWLAPSRLWDARQSGKENPYVSWYTLKERSSAQIPAPKARNLQTKWGLYASFTRNLIQSIPD